MPGHDNLDTHFSGALHGCVKIVDLEPEQHPISVGPVIPIADRTVMMVHVEAVQLKDKLPIRDQLFIGGAPMIAPAAQQTLVPSAASFHIGNGDQRLRMHPVRITPNSLHRACIASGLFVGKPELERPIPSGGRKTAIAEIDSAGGQLSAAVRVKLRRADHRVY